MMMQTRSPVKTPIVVQMEAAECGAACLAIILGYHGCHVPLERLRYQCGVSRNGCSAFSILEAAQLYGMETEGYELDVEALPELVLPAILFWRNNHFVVLEGFDKDGSVYINDPESGRRVITQEECKRHFSRVALELKLTQSFKQVGHPSRLGDALIDRLRGLKPVLAFILTVEFLLALVGIATPTFSQVFVDDILVKGYWSWRWVLLALFGVVTLSTMVLLAMRAETLRRLRAKLSVCFSSQFLWHVLKLPYLFFFQRFGGEIVQRVRLNSTVTDALTSELAATALSVVFVILYGAIMLHYDVVISLFAFLSVALNLLAWWWISESRKADYARLQREQMQLTGASLDLLLSVESIKAAAAERHFFQRVIGRQSANINSWQRIGAKDVFLVSASRLAQDFAMTTLLILGCWRIMLGDLTLGMLIAFQMLVARFTSPFAQIVSAGTRLQSLKIDLDRLNDVLKNSVDPLIGEGQTDVLPYLELPSNSPGGLEFEAVTFGYCPVDTPLFGHISLKVHPGERVAVVGRTGSGKSTLAHLSTGLLLPWSGTVRYNGSSLPEVGRAKLSEQIAVVNQEIFLFAGTIHQNLTLWDSSIPLDVIRCAAQDACIHDEITSRQGEYYGGVIEGGRNFSEGQRQRLEIARALVRSPGLLILDEATSALDVETEAEVFERLFARQMSCLVITHRLSAIQHCQRVLVLDQGRVVQEGPPSELIQKEGLFRTLLANDTFHQR